jgi:capsular exopolysaccharide synthesis family protein
MSNGKIESSEIQPLDYLKLLIRNWKWIALSILICCTIAGLYIMITPKIYERKIQIMIKEDAKRDISEPDEKTIFKDINFILSKTNINNEIELLLSENILENVIKKLHLEHCYQIRSGLKIVELYNESPVEVSFLDHKKIKESHSLTVIPLSANEVELKNFRIEYNKASNISIRASLFDTITTPLGRIIISPTIYYSKDFLNENIYVSRLNIDNVIEDIRNNIKTTTDHENTIIKLSLQNTSIQKADDILNTIIAVYNDNNITYRNQVVTNTSNFINERLKIIEKDLDLVDNDISRYKSSNMITDIKESSLLFLTESSRLNQQQAELQNQLSVAKFIKEYLINPSNNNNLIPSNSGIGDVPLEKQISEYNTIMVKKGRLLENSSEKSPSVVELTKILATMKQAIIRSVDNLIVVYGLQIDGIKGQENLINRKITNVPGKEMDIISIERRLKIQENLYLYLLQKREENELAGSFITSNFRIVNLAGGARIPIFPKSIPIMCVAFIAGFLIPSLFLSIRQLTSTKITGVEEIINNVNIPFLGVIPQAIHKRNRQKDTTQMKDIQDVICVKDNGQDDVNEAFRIVRTNIGFISKIKDETKIIMLTSLNESSGKSFVALNLAVGFAITKTKTLLIDMDMRKASISSCLHCPQTGIANYLDNANYQLDNILLKEPFHPYLDVIPVGTITANPVEILTGTRLKELVGLLKNTYDHIIIDTTPFVTTADASIIEKLSDMTIFVLMKNLSDRCKFQELENLHLNKINNMALLFNAATNY